MSDVKFDEGEIVMPVRDIFNNTLNLIFGLSPTPQEVIFNPPATIVIWNDGTKTVVKCMEGDEYSKDVGLAMCFCKKMLGSGYKRMFKKWCREEK